MLRPKEISAGFRKSWMLPEEIKEIIHDWWQNYEIADETEDNLLAYV